MNTTEDRLKDSFEAVRSVITAGDVPALEFPSRRVAQRWLVPVTAAAAAAVVVVGGTVALQGHHPHRPAAAAQPTLSPAAPPPKFYVATTIPDPIAVYSTASGRRTDVTNVSGVTRVTAAGDGKTYFAVSDRNKASFYRITVNGRGKATVTPLSIRLGNVSVTALSASRDGSKLAFAVQVNTRAQSANSRMAPPEHSEIMVADLSTRKVSTWSMPKAGDIHSLSMDAAGRTVAFSWAGATPFGAQIRLLDLTLPGRDLTTSRVVLDSSRSEGVAGTVALSPDGRYFAADIDPPSRVAIANVVEYSTVTGRPIRTVFKGADGQSDYGTITFDPTGTNLLIWGGGYHLSYVANGKAATTLAAPTSIDYESTAAW